MVRVVTAMLLLVQMWCCQPACSPFYHTLDMSSAPRPIAEAVAEWLSAKPTATALGAFSWHNWQQENTGSYDSKASRDNNESSRGTGAAIAKSASPSAATYIRSSNNSCSSCHSSIYISSIMSSSAHHSRFLFDLSLYTYLTIHQGPCVWRWTFQGQTYTNNRTIKTYIVRPWTCSLEVPRSNPHWGGYCNDHRHCRWNVSWNIW